jgi:hypothetical protein
MVTLCKKPQTPLNQRIYLMLHKLSLSPLAQLPHTPNIIPQDSTPPQLIPGGNRAHIPFRVNELKEIKKDLGNYTENPDQYIQTCPRASQPGFCNHRKSKGDQGYTHY